MRQVRRGPIITDDAFTTNHQMKVEWPENAVFNDTVKRSDFLDDLLKKNKTDASALSDAFLKPPLYTTLFEEGLGTLYTAVYLPQEGRVQLRWPNESLTQEFDNFLEKSVTICLIQFESLNKKNVAKKKIKNRDINRLAGKCE